MSNFAKFIAVVAVAAAGVFGFQAYQTQANSSPLSEGACCCGPVCACVDCTCADCTCEDCPGLRGDTAKGACCQSGKCHAKDKDSE